MTRTDLHRCYSPISFTVIRTGHAVREMERWMVPNKLREAA
uniref:PsiA protein n=1 Tax=Escherichia coli TaxID=562 RepID=A0A1L5JRH7_ECOLX|nr:PsiA protein [Escherichia coli]ASU04431.1 Plasmid SOS inhibition protein A [Escherichia coli]AWF76780.1 PsiA protein [Escherichia coli]QIS37025.1 PsiA protein [Escherichia coli]